mgnify:CR=1 FL=1
MDKVVHFEIPFYDKDKAGEFYKDVFGWEITSIQGMNYHMVKTVETDDKNMPKEHGAIKGVLIKKGITSQAPIIVISVSNLDKSLEKVQIAGGEIIQEKQEVGGMGLYARIKDTEGNVLGLWQDVKH